MKKQPKIKTEYKGKTYSVELEAQTTLTVHLPNGGLLHIYARGPQTARVDAYHPRGVINAASTHENKRGGMTINRRET